MPSSSIIADASTISGSSSIATKPEPLFCGGDEEEDEDEDKDDDDDDCDVVDADVFASAVAALPVFADVVIDALAPLVPLVLSGTPPAKTFDALTATAPTTSDFNRWRIYCAPQNSNNQNGISPLNFSTPMWVTNGTITVHRLTDR